MPVVIDELVVRVEVDESGGSRPRATQSADRQAIVEECIEQILEILDRKQER